MCCGLCFISLFIFSCFTEWKEPVGWELTARGGKGSKFVDLGQSMDPVKYVSTPSLALLQLSCYLTFSLVIGLYLDGTCVIDCYATSAHNYEIILAYSCNAKLFIAKYRLISEQYK